MRTRILEIGPLATGVTFSCFSQRWVGAVVNVSHRVYVSVQEPTSMVPVRCSETV